MNKLKYLGLFILGGFLIQALAYSNGLNRGDSSFKKIKLAPGKTVTYNVDVGKEGTLKRFLQPNSYSIHLKLLVEGKPQLTCEAEAKGMEMYVSQGSKKGLWPKLEKDYVLEDSNGRFLKTQMVRGGAVSKEIPLNIEVRFNEASLKQGIGGNLTFKENGKLYGNIQLQLVKNTSTSRG